MSPVTVYIGLGSNLDDPVNQVELALDELAQLANCRITAHSSLYRTAPMGPQDQPDYINAVVAIETSLEPVVLLDALQEIERQHGRERKGEQWGPRTLDLDLLLYGEQILDLPRLQVPHPGIKERSFVLIPLHEIAPQLVLPGGERLEQLLQGKESGEIYRLNG